MTEQVDRKDLKIQALLEKVSSLTAQYENQIADLRVDLTILSQELQSARQEAEARDVSTEEPDTSDDK